MVLLYDMWKIFNYLRLFLDVYLMMQLAIPHNIFENLSIKSSINTNCILIAINLWLQTMNRRCCRHFEIICSRIGCADHYLSKQLQHAFESEQIHLNRNTIEKVECDLAQTIFNEVKKIVSSVRRSHQQRKLSRQLQTYSQTRFGGAIIMLNVFREVFFELPEVLINTKIRDDYSLIDKESLDDICDFLEAFEEVIDALNEDKQPSLHRVIPLRQHLINKCQLKEADSMTVIQLKIFLDKSRKEVY